MTPAQTATTHEDGGRRMIDLYASSSPNVQKIVIMLEETGLPYFIKQVNVHRGEQHAPDFVALNPNRKVLVIVDQDGPGGKPYTVFESGAVLLYLAHKTGRFLPSDVAKQFDAIQWLMIQLTGIGPMIGQFNHFVRFAADSAYALDRYVSETRRLYDLIDARLQAVPYLGGDDYSIADIATFANRPELLFRARGIPAFADMRTASPRHCAPKRRSVDGHNQAAYT